MEAHVVGDRPRLRWLLLLSRRSNPQFPSDRCYANVGHMHESDIGLKGTLVHSPSSHAAPKQTQTRCCGHGRSK
jgi:hypothetical protein